MYKYEKGDKVIYLDNQGYRQSGIVVEVDKTIDGKRNLYLLHNYPYLRFENEIVEIDKSKLIK